ncbi:hypothetical protein ON010_g17289 [Phytophthora cinnamomi]|nr:hypothetical protein ON010_g17289 [Phytophthora cinnamomi]
MKVAMDVKIQIACGLRRGHLPSSREIYVSSLGRSCCFAGERTSKQSCSVLLQVTGERGGYYSIVFVLHAGYSLAAIQGSDTTIIRCLGAAAVVVQKTDGLIARLNRLDASRSKSNRTQKNIKFVALHGPGAPGMNVDHLGPILKPRHGTARLGLHPGQTPALPLQQYRELCSPGDFVIPFAIPQFPSPHRRPFNQVPSFEDPRTPA